MLDDSIYLFLFDFRLRAISCWAFNLFFMSLCKGFDDVFRFLISNSIEMWMSCDIYINKDDSKESIWSKIIFLALLRRITPLFLTPVELSSLKKTKSEQSTLIYDLIFVRHKNLLFTTFTLIYWRVVVSYRSPTT